MKASELNKAQERLDERDDYLRFIASIEAGHDLQITTSRIGCYVYIPTVRDAVLTEARAYVTRLEADLRALGITEFDTATAVPDDAPVIDDDIGEEAA